VRQQLSNKPTLPKAHAEIAIAKNTLSRAPADDGIHMAQFEAGTAKSFFRGLGSESDVSWAAKT
jgi:hypothetical protein